jgi:hypothetical protein
MRAGRLSMGMDSWTTAKRGAFESAEVFAQPPYKSLQFIAVSIIVALSVFLACAMLVDLAGRLSLLAMTWMSFIPIVVLLNWMRTLIAHRRLHELYVSAMAERPPEPSLDIALRAASSLSYWGTLAAAFAGIAGLAALIQVIGRAR